MTALVSRKFGLSCGGLVGERQKGAGSTVRRGKATSITNKTRGRRGTRSGQWGGTKSVGRRGETGWSLLHDPRCRGRMEKSPPVQKPGGGTGGHHCSQDEVLARSPVGMSSPSDPVVHSGTGPGRRPGATSRRYHRWVVTTKAGPLVSPGPQGTDGSCALFAATVVGRRFRVFGLCTQEKSRPYQRRGPQRHPLPVSQGQEHSSGSALASEHAVPSSWNGRLHRLVSGRGQPELDIAKAAFCVPAWLWAALPVSAEAIAARAERREEGGRTRVDLLADGRRRQKSNVTRALFARFIRSRERERPLSGRVNAPRRLGRNAPWLMLWSRLLARVGVCQEQD